MNKKRFLIKLVLFFFALQACSDNHLLPIEKAEKKSEIPKNINLLEVCNWNFAKKMIEGVEYIECKKSVLVLRPKSFDRILHLLPSLF